MNEWDDENKVTLPNCSAVENVNGEIGEATTALTKWQCEQDTSYEHRKCIPVKRDESQSCLPKKWHQLHDSSTKKGMRLKPNPFSSEALDTEADEVTEASENPPYPNLQW